MEPSFVWLFWVAATVGVGFFWWRRSKGGADGSGGLGTLVNTPGTLVVQDGAGNQLFVSHELRGLPAEARPLSDAATLHRGRQLAADLTRAGATLPGRTLEIAFDPKVQQGLKDGALVLTPAKAGGQFLDARHVEGGKFAGKGRLVSGSQGRQLAVCAFQLLSIAVAQSHLADINRGMNQLQDGVDAIRSRLDRRELSRLTVAMDILRRFLDRIRAGTLPEEVSIEERVELRQIAREVQEWTRDLESDAQALQLSVVTFRDADTFGTGRTHEMLRQRGDEFEQLVYKHGLLVQLRALLNLSVATLHPLDPAAAGMAVRDAPDFCRHFGEVRQALRDCANQMLSRAVFNKDETLRQRRSGVVDKTEQTYLLLERQQKEHDQVITELDTFLARMRGANGKLRLGVSFDNAGEVDKVAVL